MFSGCLISGFCVSQEKEDLKQRERQKRRTRMDNISTLTAMGYSRRDAARALHRADGDMNKACGVSICSSLCFYEFVIRGGSRMKCIHHSHDVTRHTDHCLLIFVLKQAEMETKEQNNLQDY